MRPISSVGPFYRGGSPNSVGRATEFTHKAHLALCLGPSEDSLSWLFAEEEIATQGLAGETGLSEGLKEPRTEGCRSADSGQPLPLGKLCRRHKVAGQAAFPSSVLVTFSGHVPPRSHWAHCHLVWHYSHHHPLQVGEGEPTTLNEGKTACYHGLRLSVAVVQGNEFGSEDGQGAEIPARGRCPIFLWTTCHS